MTQRHAISNSRRSACRKGAQRGVLHVLFIIFAVIGVSLWGISEFLLSAEEESREITAESVVVATETKDILLNYALNPPPFIVDNVPDCGIHNQQGCYNYYNNTTPTLRAFAKNTPLSLPCPDLAVDGNLDGASDVGSAGCNSQIAGSLQYATLRVDGRNVTLHHRFGRLPWRDERANGLYTRGLGNRDLRDGAAARLWYGISRNVAPCVINDPEADNCPYFENTNAAINALALLTLTTGWLTVISQNDNGDQVVISDRVAAVVISPGSADNGQQRPDEDILYSGAGADVTAVLPTIAVAENYVEGENADGDDTFFLYGQYGISLQIGPTAGDGGTTPTRHSEDHIEYITIDELAAAYAAQNTNLPAAIAAQLMDGYYNRHGFYPDPALFHATAGENRTRTPGPPPTQPRNINAVSVLLREAKGRDNIRNIRIRLADLPPVYLAPGWRFQENPGDFDNDPSFPFNEALAKMKTKLADASLQEIAGSGDILSGYQYEYADAGHAVPPEQMYGADALLFTVAAGENRGPVFDFVARAPEIRADERVVRVILAEPMALNSAASMMARFPGDETVPAQAADVILPAGTELELQVGADTYVQFPAGLQLRGRRYRGAVSQTQEFPHLRIPLRARNVTFSYTNVRDPNDVLYFDGNGELPRTGPALGWMRPVAPDGTASRYEVRPVFLMRGAAGSVPDLVGRGDADYDDTGYLTRATRGGANNNSGLEPHYFQLQDVQVRDRGGFAGFSPSPDDLEVRIEIRNPSAWSFPGNNDFMTSRDLDDTTNAHLNLFYLDGAGRARPNPQRRQAGSGQLIASGSRADLQRNLRVNFARWPFSQVLIHNNSGQFGQCDPYCPYSGGFFAEEVIISLSISPSANIPSLRHVAGIELTEPTLLPARLVDRGGDAFAVPARILPAGEEAVAGPGGFVPAMRASAAMDPRYFVAGTVSRIRNIYGNAAGHLYFPLTIAGLNPRAVVAFPPPGRPAVRGTAGGTADSATEQTLEDLPHPLEIPPGVATGLPVGTRIIFPNTGLSQGAISIVTGRDFVFPEKALAILPKGAQLFVSLAIAQIRPDGTEVLPLTPVQDYLRLPHGGVMEIAGMRALAGGGRFDEMLEMEIRGGAVGVGENGANVDLADGAMFQPFTGRMISPRVMEIPDGAEISGETRVRARFTRRPTMAPRTGELNEPVFPLELEGATLTSQAFPAGVFLFENGRPAGAVDWGFDEDTEFTLPAGFTLAVRTRGWPGGGQIGAITNPTGAGYYRFVSTERQNLVLSLVLPAETRVYDKRFSASGLRADQPFTLPLAGDLGGGGGGQARFNFVLFPQSDMIMRVGPVETVIPAGSAVDMTERRILPPVGFFRLPRVAGDLELASNGPMMIYIGENLHAVFEYAEVHPDAPPSSTANRVHLPYQALQNAAGRQPPRYDAASGGMGDTPGQGGNELLNIPQGAIILIPPGDRLPLHANYMLTVNGAQSHMRLPPDAVMILRAGQSAEFQGGESIDGPAYVRLGGMAADGRPAVANLVMENVPSDAPDSGQSFVMMTEPARTRSRPGARLDAPVGHISPRARLDLFGNIETRAEGWFFHEMLPSAAGEALKNFPMVMAVASECRRSSAAGDKCDQENFEGLTFDIPIGEEIELPQDTPAPRQFRIESGDGGAFRASLFVEGRPPRGADITTYVRVAENGRIATGDGFTASDFFDFDPPRHLVLYPSPAGLRVYLGLGARPSNAADLTREREETNYVESFQPLTVYNGGYTGNGYQTPQNLAVAELPTGQEFILGAETRLFDGGMRPGAFGEGSFAHITYAPGGQEYRRDLKDYVAVNEGSRPADFFHYSVSLGAQITRVDDFGRVEEHFRAADLVEATPGPSDEFLRARAYDAFVHAPRLQLEMGQALDMEPGYLWQGVIPPGGAALRFTRNDALHNVYWPPSPESPVEGLMQSRILLRTHPSDPALNFFGAGVETVEGLDGQAGEVGAREVLAMSEALFQDFSGSDYAPVNARNMQGYRTTVRDPSGSRLLQPYYGADERPYLVNLGDSAAARESHGVNPNILQIPPDQRLNLLSEHALRVNYTGDYVASGRGDAEGRSYNAADPLFFANWILHGGIPNPGLASAQDDRFLTTLPASGVKVRRVRLGMDPVGARLNADNLFLRMLANLTGTPECVTFRRFGKGPVPVLPADVDRADPDYPGDPCPPIGRADHLAGFDAHFALRVTNNTYGEFGMNPPMLAVVRELGTGRALTITTHWTNYYGSGPGLSGPNTPRLAGRIIWGGNRLPLNLNPGGLADFSRYADGIAPANFSHILPSNTAFQRDFFGNDNIEFLYDQDWDWFAYGGRPVTAGFALDPEDDRRHISMLTGPLSNISPDDVRNYQDSGLFGADFTDAGMPGMCGIAEGDFLDVRFAAPPIQLAALDVTPGLAWPRPGRRSGTADLDKRIAGTFIPRADRLELMARLSPFDHSAPNPDQNPRTQNRYLRGLEQGEMTMQPFSARPGSFAEKVPPAGIPQNRDRRARTADDVNRTTPNTATEITPANPRETRIYSEAYVYMDRPFDPEYMGGKQQLIIGPNFRVEGPAALVPPFGAANDRAAADIAAQRSRMMNDLFDIPPLNDIYNASAAAADCGGMNPCPAMWTRNDWAPVLAGVVAMEAVNMEIDNINDPEVLNNIYFIQPQPELAVRLANGQSTVLLAGSVIFPYSGQVIPARTLGETARLAVEDRQAVAAVDVSPAVAPTPVRIFREKTHTARHLVNVPRGITQRGRFHIDLQVYNLLWFDGGPIFPQNSCPAFIQGAIAAGTPEAFAPVIGFPQLGAGFVLYETFNFPANIASIPQRDIGPAITRRHNVLADIRGQIPLGRYSENIEVYSRYHKPSGGTDFRNLHVINEFESYLPMHSFVFNPIDNVNALPRVVFDIPEGDAAVRRKTAIQSGDFYDEVLINPDRITTPNLAGRGIQPFSPLEPRFALTDVGRYARAVRPSQNATNTRGLHWFEAGLPRNGACTVREHPSRTGFIYRCPAGQVNRRGFCAGLVPPGTLQDENNPLHIEVRVPVGTNPRQGIRRIPASGNIVVTATISQPNYTGLGTRFFAYSHENAEPFGFNTESLAQVNARGDIPPDLTAADPLFTQLEAACPNCQFIAADPAVPGSNLTVMVPFGDTLQRVGTRTEHVIQSYDFAAAQLDDANPVRQLSEYQAGNVVNDYFQPGNAQCAAAHGVAACNFLQGTVRRNPNYGAAVEVPGLGMRHNVTHTIAFADPSSGARIVGMEFLPRDHAGNVHYQFTNFSEPGAPTRVAGQPNAFEFEVLEYDGRRARMPDGLDADGTWWNAESIPPGLTQIEGAHAPDVQAIIAAILRNVTNPDRVAAARALEQAYTLRISGNSDYFDPIEALPLDSAFLNVMHDRFMSQVEADGGIIYDRALPNSRDASLARIRVRTVMENLLVLGAVVDDFQDFVDSIERQREVVRSAFGSSHFLITRYTQFSDAANLLAAGQPYLHLVSLAMFEPAPPGVSYTPLGIIENTARDTGKTFRRPAAGASDAAILSAVESFYQSFQVGSIPYILNNAAESLVLDGNALVASPSANRQGTGFAVRVELEFTGLVPQVFQPGAQVARIPIRLVTYDDTVVPVTRATNTLYAYVELTPSGLPPPDHNNGGGRALVASYPVSIGVIQVTDDLHYGEVRERYSALEVASGLAGLPSGAQGGDYFTRMEHPLNFRSDLGFSSPSRRSRWTSRILGSEFHFAPVRAGQCVVEPLGFLPTYDVEYADPSGISPNAAVYFASGSKVTARVPAVANLRWHESDSDARGYYPSRFEVLGGNINEVRRYDGSFTRGFLARPHIAELFSEYYSGGGAWRGHPLSSGKEFVDLTEFADFPSPARQSTDPAGLDLVDGVGAGAREEVEVDLYPGSFIGDFDAALPRGNEKVRMRNPLSHLWQARRNVVHPEVLGVQRMGTRDALRMVRQSVCGADASALGEVRESIQENWCLQNLTGPAPGPPDPVPNPYDFYDPENPFLMMVADPPASRDDARYGIMVDSLRNLFRRVTVGGIVVFPDFDHPRVRVPYLPLGVNLQPDPDGDDNHRPIQALRLPHAVGWPLLSELELIPGGLGYPSSPERFHSFPPGARGFVMNADMSSWESIHPGLAATRGGLAYSHVSSPNVLGTLSRSPSPLDASHGEAFWEFDAGGRRVLHYHRSESAPAEEPTSARQVHSNAWVRLASEAILQRDGRRTRLAEGTVLNPIHATYVRPPVEGRRGSWRSELPWPSRAVGSSEGGNLKLVRAALILPKGTKLVLQGSSAKMRKVRAAVFFSPTPLEIADCPHGANGQVNQLRFGRTLSDGSVFSLGHPCAWLDDPENVDGDREFIYTNRPRWNSTNTRLLSNDRVVLLGGELEF